MCCAACTTAHAANFEGSGSGSASIVANTETGESDAQAQGSSASAGGDGQSFGNGFARAGSSDDATGRRERTSVSADAGGFTQGGAVATGDASSTQTVGEDGAQVGATTTGSQATSDDYGDYAAAFSFAGVRTSEYVVSDADYYYSTFDSAGTSGFASVSYTHLTLPTTPYV